MSWRCEKIRVPWIQLSKTFQSEYLIFPGNSTVEISGLTVNCIKTKNGDDGILYLSQSVRFWNTDSFMMESQSKPQFE